MAFPRVIPVSDQTQIQDKRFDGMIFISDTLTCEWGRSVTEAISNQLTLDKRVGKQTLLIASKGLPGDRLVFAPTGVLNRDYDDVRRVYDAARDAAAIARDAGMIKPLLCVELSSSDKKYAHAAEVAYLGLCQGLWQPLEARESHQEDGIEPMEQVGVLGISEQRAGFIQAVESGRRVARDLCGTEPERMAPPMFAEYCQAAFENSAVAVDVIDDDQHLREHYPLLHGVARASVEVKRHQARVIRLEYTGDGPIERTLFIAGKGITFDTGGADLKVGGHMAGMSRDKGGAAAAAGLMKVLAEMRPAGVKVVAVLGAVRNSIGAEAFVPDEIITSHAKVRVRVGNTDAEGRMVLADILSHLRLEAKQAVAPELFSIATLTGHAALAFGPYSALVENGPALAARTAERICEAGEKWADPAEQSRSRREDFDFIRNRTLADDVLSSNNAPSVSTVRGHQFPMAFLSIASGLAAHGTESDQPLPYTHIDIAGSGIEKGDWQHGKPTAAPVAALAAYLGM